MPASIVDNKYLRECSPVGNAITSESTKNATSVRIYKFLATKGSSRGNHKAYRPYRVEYVKW